MKDDSDVHVLNSDGLGVGGCSTASMGLEDYTHPGHRTDVCPTIPCPVYIYYLLLCLNQNTVSDAGNSRDEIPQT